MVPGRMMIIRTNGQTMYTMRSPVITMQDFNQQLQVQVLHHSNQSVSFLAFQIDRFILDKTIKRVWIRYGWL